MEKKKGLSKANRQRAYKLGQAGEAAALAYLKSKRFSVVLKGFRLPQGEIDIIAYDKKTLVFIEVKTRQDRALESPEESVTPSKQKRIRRLAEAYLTRYNLQDVECRFDVLSLIGNDVQGYRVHHIKEAF